MQFAQRITISKGRAGLRPDFYPAVVASEPKTEYVNGRLTTTADVVYVRTTQAGERILAMDPQNLRFALPARIADDGWVELLDGPKAQPHTVSQILSNFAQQTVDFLMSKPVASDTIDLDVEAEAASA
jgi:hypothetical protein